MKTAGIRTEDLVMCDVRGRRFLAEVKETGVAIQGQVRANGLRVKAIAPVLTYTLVTPTQVVTHYKKMKGGLA